MSPRESARIKAKASVVADTPKALFETTRDKPTIRNIHKKRKAKVEEKAIKGTNSKSKIIDKVKTKNETLKKIEGGQSSTPNTIVTADDGKNRCWWCCPNIEYMNYHDEEWGVAVHDDQKLFEALCLEGAQAGLSFLTILKKRENYRSLFHSFNIQILAALEGNQQFIEKLVLDPGIVRHRGKIQAVVHNAKLIVENVLVNHKSLDAFFWKYVNNCPLNMSGNSENDKNVKDISERMSKDLKKMGFKFVGPTICLSFMQAVGMISDHHPLCHKNLKA